MSGIINVFLATMSDSQHAVQLKNGFTVEDIRKVVLEKFSTSNFRLVVNGQEIQDNAPTKFAELKKSIKNNTVIYVCQRMNRGSGMVGIDSHKATILVDLQDEFDKVSAQQKNSECMVCREEKKCIKFCCSSILCKKCFPNYFVHSDYKIICVTCNKILPPEKVFVTPQFIQSLVQLQEKRLLARNIDFQICTCGAFCINSTMYAKQKCENCQRVLCFFCNSDWDEQEKKMRNEKYTCRVNCYWETKISYEMVKFVFSENMQIPSRRCCPKCFECDSYDQKDKYHTCKCGHKFCFICLKSHVECMLIFKSAYNKPCVGVARQTFDMFPRLCHDG